MNDADTAVFWLNMGCAAVSCAINAYAAFVNDPRWRPFNAAVSAMSLLFVGGYIWVITTEDVTSWSRVFRGVSLVAFPLVWWTPALLSMHIHQRDMRKLDNAGKQIRLKQ
jgi:hypothetical protein